jgi:hypothetical protein
VQEHGVDPLFSAQTLPPPRLSTLPDDGLGAFVNVNVFDRDFLRALAAVAIEGFKQRRVCPRELIRLTEIFPPSQERLLAKHGAPVTFHRGVVTHYQLGGEHSFDLVTRRDPDEARDRCAALFLGFLNVGIF